MRTTSNRPTPSQSVPGAIAGLMFVAAASLLTASLIHSGMALPLGLTTISDSFLGAAIPEAVIGLVVAAGAANVLWGSFRWAVALAALLFALAGTGFGLSLTAGSGRTGDIVYHAALLIVLLAALVLLLSPRGRRDLPAHDHPSNPSPRHAHTSRRDHA